MKLQKSLAVILLLIICSNLSAQRNKGRKMTATAEMQSGKIIDFTNTVIDLNNQQSNKWVGYQSFIDAARIQADKLIKRRNAETRAPIEYNVTPIAPVYIMKYEAVSNKKVIFPEKEQIESAVKKAREDVNTLDEWSTRLNNYFVNKLYVQDESLLVYAELSDSVESHLDISRKSWRNAVTLAADAGEDAEIVALRNKSVAEYTIPIRKNMRTFRGLMYEFYDLNKNPKADYSELSAKVDSYKVSLDESKPESVNGANDLKFYDAMTTCSEYLSNLLSELISEDADNNTIEYNNKQMTESYSQLVKLYKDYIAEFSRK